MSTSFTECSEPQEMIQAVRDWIEEDEKTTFNTNFIDSLEKQLEDGRDLSPNQTKALHNICHSFNIG